MKKFKLLLIILNYWINLPKTRLKIVRIVSFLFIIQVIIMFFVPIYIAEILFLIDIAILFPMLLFAIKP